MKKLISVILSMTMVLCMAMTGFAEGTGTCSITINNSATGHKYEAYQIIAGDLSGGKFVNAQWGKDVDASTLGNVSDKITALENGTTTAKAFAELVAPLTTTNSGSATQPSDGKYVISNLDPGYYLVKDIVQKGEDGTDTPLGEGDAYSAYILKVVGNVETNPKTSVPTVEKKVKDINDSTETALSGWQDSADHDINDNIKFQLTATLGDRVDDYDTYELIFHDTLSAGLTYASDNTDQNPDNNITIMMGNTDVTEKFEISTAPGENGATNLTISCENVKDFGATNGSVITVEYTAKLNENAVIGSAGNPNDVYLEYSNNPNGSQTGKTEKDKVIVFTYKTIIDKVDSNKQPLTGAAFTLQKLNAATGEYEDVKVYTVDATNPATQFVFEGLDDGKYKLIESTTPDGYNTMKDVEFEITASHDIDSADPKLQDLNGNKITGEISFTPNKDAGSLSAQVVNNTGAELPETGGIGTKIFYVVGAALVIGAGVLLITRKRMSTR